MIKYRLFSACLCIFLTSLCKSQSLQSEVISCLGEQATSSSIRLSYTCGEPFAESSILNLNMHSGFQQGILANITSSESVAARSNEYIVYPNPGADVYNVLRSSSAMITEPMQVDVFDANGRNIQMLRSAEPLVLLDLSAHPAGIYYIRVSDRAGVHNLPIIKMHP